jgi:hypothetical protein
MVNMNLLGSQVFNMGGGPQRTVSLLEVLDLMGERGAPRGAVGHRWAGSVQRMLGRQEACEAIHG